MGKLIGLLFMLISLGVAWYMKYKLHIHLVRAAKCGYDRYQERKHTNENV